MKSTELNLIPFFVAVYEEESMSKAAQRLGVSQPAVSKALKRFVRSMTIHCFIAALLE
ncbi:transcriptional regulator [Vibrio ishigakensis]|uniref:Transcriptional regulator n=1 Tax=Vibrio ishigakensis TaxID=1481914 RepID=A0A0B8QDZ3_9VIBR|nr:transcriptional regulator [Vibrio ishigakensis]